MKENYVNWQILFIFCLLILLNLCCSSTLLGNNSFKLWTIIEAGNHNVPFNLNTLLKFSFKAVRTGLYSHAQPHFCH